MRGSLDALRGPGATPSLSASDQLVTIGADLTVRRIGFGAMALTGRGVWGEPSDPAAARTLLQAAVGLGVEFIDTADSYGPDVSETLIAEALYPYPDGLVIATKGGFVREGPWQMRVDGRPEHLRAACDGSLRRLRLDAIPLYQLHTVDGRVPFEESIGALAELRRQGKVRHVGLSNVTIAQVDLARTLVPIASVQNRYNLAERDSEDVLRYCEREGIVFSPWFPLAKGALAKARGPLLEIARSLGSAPAQVALAWLLRRSPATLPIPGTTSIMHLEENVAAATLELTEEQLDLLERIRPAGVGARTFARRVARRTIGPFARPLLRRISR